MADELIMETGSINWVDLTVPDASGVRDFYHAVVGWNVTPVDMGGYEDYSMTTPGTGRNTAGICHHRGANEGIPPVWLIYITVENLDDSLKACTERGGKILRAPKSVGGQAVYAIIQDPAGAVCALFQSNRKE